VIDFDDRLACWIRNEPGTAPLTVSPDIPYQTAAMINQTTHSLCALAVDGSVWCTPGAGGWQKFLQPLQLSPLISLPGPLRDISASYPDRYCGVTNEGELWCWGTGPLGDGPASINGAPRRVPVPDGIRFTSLHLNLDLACAIDTAGTPWCWGTSFTGSLPGLPARQVQETPVPVLLPAPIRKLRIIYSDGICGIADDQRVICWGNKRIRGLSGFTDPGEAPTYLPAWLRLSDIEVMLDGFVGLTQGGVVYRWGCSEPFHGGCIDLPSPSASVHQSLRASALTRSYDAWYGCIRALGTDEIVCTSVYEWFRPVESEWYSRNWPIWSPPPIARP
jgi:hypothetical protein